MTQENSNIFLSGKMTNLRPPSRADLPLMTRWINDPEVREYLATVLPQTEKQEEEWFNKIGSDSKNIVLCVETKDQKPIGMMGLHAIDWINRHATTGALIGDKEFWGKGYGTDAKLHLLHYAFDTLNLHKVKSQVIAYNERSVRYSLRCGYHEEGRFRKEKFRRGEYHDIVNLAIFREDWAPVWDMYQETGSVR